MISIIGVSPATADDRDPPGGLPAHPRTEDLQVPPAAEGALEVHQHGPPRPLTDTSGPRHNEAHRYILHQQCIYSTFNIDGSG